MNQSQQQAFSEAETFCNITVLEIIAISQQNTCNEVLFLIDLESESATFLEIGLQCQCFPMSLAKFFKAAILQHTFARLFLPF